jgi:hypothetical protein
MRGVDGSAYRPSQFLSTVKTAAEDCTMVSSIFIVAIRKRWERGELIYVCRA